MRATNTNDIDIFLKNLLIDTINEDTQLTTLHEYIENTISFPCDVFVADEPMRLLGVQYDGNPRRGLIAKCARLPDSSKATNAQDFGVTNQYLFSLADIQMPAEQQAYQCLELYCRWVGITPNSPNKAVESASGNSQDSERLDLDVTGPIDLIVLTRTERNARCRQPGDNRVVTLRSTDAYKLAPGAVITIAPEKFWYFNGHPYLSGNIESTRADADALGLIPLQLINHGEYIPNDYNGNPDSDTPRNTALPRADYEMQNLVPGSDHNGFCPIVESVELREQGNFAEAENTLLDLLEAEPRCIDAHAHLGGMTFEHFPQHALNHYEVGISIGEQALGNNFDGFLRWSHLNNRPFLRCLHGYILCLWRLARWDEAQEMCQRVLKLDPIDHLGIELILPKVKARQPIPSE